MSLFFLILTLFTFFWAQNHSKKTKPHADQSFYHHEFIVSNLDEFHQSIKNWVASQKRLRIIDKENLTYIIEESPRLISYGYFYHISIHPYEHNFKVNVSIQAKLISSTFDKKNITRQISKNLELKNVS